MDLKYPERAARFADEVRAFVRKELPAEIRDKVQRRQKNTPEDQRTWQRKLCDKGWACPHGRSNMAGRVSIRSSG